MSKDWYHHGRATYAREVACECDACAEAIVRAELIRCTLPFAPLAPFTPTRDEWGGYPGMGGVKAVFSETQQRSWYRAKRRGFISPAIADELCVALGYHPFEIFGEAWLTA
jgi:hypothetical protein